MRYLLISLFFCTISCTSYIKKNNFKEVTFTNKVVKNPYFSDVEKDYVYKAKIKVYDNNFGGIFIVKKIDESNHRVVFTTEMGSKIFDFSFKKDSFKVNYILDELDKKILINILEKDFRVLVREHQDIISKSEKGNTSLLETKILKKNYFYKLWKDRVLNSIVRVANGKEKVHILFSDIHEASAKNIQILHHNIKLEINLKSIN
jgi:hypothetical protein